MMTANRLTLLLFLTAFSLRAQSDLNTQYDELIQATYKANGPGAAVLVAKKDQILYQKAFGMANLELAVPLSTEHVFRIGSVSKQFTAVAILQLVEAGKISLQDPLTKFIPDYPTHGKTITIEHLLTHTSGIKNYTDMEQWTDPVHRKDFLPLEIVDFFKNEPMDFDPGQDWNYSNSGYVLLGYIIEKVSSMGYADYISEKLFKPLGMQHSRYDQTLPVIKNRASGYMQGGENGVYLNAPYLSMTQPYAAGSLISTVGDLFIWTRAVHTGKILKNESLKKAFTPYILPNGKNTHYGYGWSIGNLLGSETIEHTGGIHGFLSDLLYVPEAEVCVAILTNCDCEPPRDLTARLAALAAGKAFQPSSISLPESVLQQYVGVYENTTGEQRVIRIENGQLSSMRTGGSQYKIHPYAPDQFYFEESFSRISFERDKKSGKKIIQAVVSDRKSTDNIWQKTDKPLPASKPELQLPTEQLDKYVGEYQIAPGFSIIVTREGTQLFCQATGQSRFEVFAESQTRFFLKVVDASIEFYADEKGMVNKMILFQAGQEIPGTRIK